MNTIRTRDILPNMRTVDDFDTPYSKEHQERRALYDLYWRYFRGDHRKPIKVRTGQADDNVILNWSRKIVGQGVSFLFGDDISFEVDEETDRSPEEQYLDELWEDNPRRKFSMLAFLQAVGQNGGVTGTAFIRLYPGMDGERPYLRNIDPALVEVITNPDDVDEVTGYYIVWRAGELWKRHRIERQGPELWLITEEEKEKRARQFSVIAETPWPYSWAPMFHCQNLILANSVYGVSDLEDADLNDAVNFIASNTNRIVRYHAHPKTIGTGFTGSQLSETAVDSFWTIANDTAKVFNLEMQSDLASSRQYRADLEEAFHQISDVPRLNPAEVSVGALSGFALRILYGPLLQKTAIKRLTYGGMLSQINAALLELGGFEPVPVRVKWGEALPESTKERADHFKILADAGVELETAARIAGYSERDIQLIEKSGDSFLMPGDGVINDFAGSNDFAENTEGDLGDQPNA